jgi:hypothetical protein
MKCEFWQMRDEHTDPVDPVTVDLVDHTVAGIN